jgi:hypothetical protein
MLVARDLDGDGDRTREPAGTSDEYVGSYGFQAMNKPIHAVAELIVIPARHLTGTVMARCDC